MPFSPARLLLVTFLLVTCATAGLALPAQAADGTSAAGQTHGVTDPTGDVEGDAGPATQPEADIVAVGVEHTGAEVVLRLRVERPTDPRTSPNWKGATAVLWGLDTTGDAQPDYLVAYSLDEGGQIVVEAGRMTGSEEDAPLCRGTGSFAADMAYVAAVPATCLGDPAVLRYGGATAWDTNPADDAAAVVGDAAPDDVMAGPVEPPPGTGSTGGADPGLSPEAGGYWLVGRDGGVFSFNERFWGSTGHLTLNQPIVGMAADPDGEGYWFVASDGGVFAFEAGFYGSTGDIRLNEPIVGMAPTPTGRGYWLVARDGGIFAFGDAGFFGSTGAIRLSQPIVGMAATATGRGYSFVAADGGYFTFGDAVFMGSMGGALLEAPIVGMAATRTGRGYWMVGRRGDVFSYGDARFEGSAQGSTSPVVAIASARDGIGYSISRVDGSVVNRGSAPRAGSLAGKPLNQPVVGIASTP